MAKYTRYVPTDFGSAPVGESTPAATTTYVEPAAGTSSIVDTPAEPSPVYTRAEPKRSNKGLLIAAPIALLAIVGGLLWASSGDDAAETETAGVAEPADEVAANAGETSIPVEETVPVEVAEAEAAPLPAATPLPTPVVNRPVAERAPPARVVARAAPRPRPAPVVAQSADDVAADVSTTEYARPPAVAVTPSTPSVTPAPAPAAPLVIDTPPLVVEPASEPAPAVVTP